MAPGFSPLDEELGLLPGALTPPLHAHLSRLGCRLSFAAATAELRQMKGVTVSAATARRHTEGDGAVYAALEEAEAARVLATAPPAAAGPPVQQVSVDGAMVPLRDGSWREVRTLAIGTVAPGRAAGEAVSTALSYFSRLADAASFTRLAAGEVHRRGVETAGLVAGVVDGALWCQAFFDVHRPDAVRILDFGHAAEHLSPVAEAVWGGGAAAQTWATAQRHLLHEDAAAVLAAIRTLPLAAAADPVTAQRVQAQVLGYLEPRLEQMRYAAFRAQGLPIGSGAVESANKLVVEDRLKGAGRRWAEGNVNSMLALRGALCSDRWEEAWTAIAAARQHRRRPARPDTATAVRPSVASAAAVAAPIRRPHQPAIPVTPRPGPKRIVNGRPTATHPWKRFTATPSAPIPKL